MLIFVLDDELVLGKSTKKIVEEAVPGALVLTFTSGREALRAVAEGSQIPDIVFSDIEMPGMGGLEFAVRLKKISPVTQICFVTGYSKYAPGAFPGHVSGYLLKPVDVEDVREVLRFSGQGGKTEPDPGNMLPTAQKQDRKWEDRLQVQCFGDFEIFWKGEPLLFSKSRTKELFAFLIDRQGEMCTLDEITASLWEKERKSFLSVRIELRELIRELSARLREIGQEAVIRRKIGQLSVHPALLDCDYYCMLAGDINALNSFRGDYMAQYSWAEITASRLHFHSVG